MTKKLQKAQESLEQSHVCGACENSFPTEQAYLDHECPKTGFAPTEIEHQDALTDGQFSKVSAAALKRGEARVGEKMHPSEALAEKRKKQNR